MDDGVERSDQARVARGTPLIDRGAAVTCPHDGESLPSEEGQTEKKWNLKHELRNGAPDKPASDDQAGENAGGAYIEHAHRPCEREGKPECERKVDSISKPVGCFAMPELLSSWSAKQKRAGVDLRRINFHGEKGGCGSRTNANMTR